MPQGSTFTYDLSSLGVGIYLIATTGNFAGASHLFAIVNIGTAQQRTHVLSSNNMSVSVSSSIVTITYNYPSVDGEYITICKLY